MLEALSIALAGALVGCVHVLGGPDHIVSLLPFSVEARGQAWRIGLRWGVGHALGIVGVGVVARVARGLLDLGALENLGESLVGGVLVCIGAWGVYHARKLDLSDVDTAPPSPEGDDAKGGGHGTHVHGWAALAVGGVHGVAGSAAVLGVIPVLGFGSTLAAAGHLAGFAIGTVASMVWLSVVLGWMTEMGIRRGGGDLERTYRRILSAASGIAVFVGLAFIATQLFA